MRSFRRIILAILAAGVLSGVLASAAFWLLTLPAETTSPASTAASPTEQAASTGRTVVLDGARPKTVEPTTRSAPRSGGQRFVAGLIANCLTGLAFALLLATLFGVQRSGGALPGLGWAIAGFAAFFLLPVFGAQSLAVSGLVAPLALVNLWYWMAASCAAVGLALLFLQRHWILRIAAFGICAVPFLLGTPRSRNGMDLNSLFADPFWTVTGINLMFWLLLGLLAGVIMGRPRRYDDLA